MSEDVTVRILIDASRFNAQMRKARAAMAAIERRARERGMDWVQAYSYMRIYLPTDVKLSTQDMDHGYVRFTLRRGRGIAQVPVKLRHATPHTMRQLAERATRMLERYEGDDERVRYS